MPAIIVMALAAALATAAVKNKGEVPQSWDPKPCDAKTGCLHPAFK